ncbi:MAG: hypothetical protein ACSLEY_01990 [Candidatus Saccharimonadales bacterium]
MTRETFYTLLDKTGHAAMLLYGDHWTPFTLNKRTSNAIGAVSDYM